MHAGNNMLLVLGSGPGIGSQTAKRFAEKHHFSHIALASRNAERLNAEAEEVRKIAGKDVKVTTHVTDMSDMKSLSNTLQEVEKLTPLECVFYNGARINITDPLKAPIEELEQDYRVCNSHLAKHWLEADMQ
jgi:NAD(P)-dependent dehydrogenase (short-subunit alcohol dehydrogenase family)